MQHTGACSYRAKTNIVASSVNMSGFVWIWKQSWYLQHKNKLGWRLIFVSPFLDKCVVRSLDVWYKQWKVRSSCLKKVALRNSQGSSDFLEERSPKGKSDVPREFLWAIFYTTTEDIPLFVRLLDLNGELYRAQSNPRFNSEHIPVTLG